VAKFYNFYIWVIIVLAALSIVFLIIQIIKRKSYKEICITLLVFLTSLVLVILFYYPKQINNPEKINILDISYYGRDVELDASNISKLTTLLEKQTIIRNANKTVFYNGHFPANETIYIHISGHQTNINVQIRKDHLEKSFIEENGQYYNIRNVEEFKKEVENFIQEISL
jgi:glucan phosphoethanolaminetransferase (alkaline phosphatase superfamily)